MQKKVKADTDGMKEVIHDDIDDMFMGKVCEAVDVPNSFYYSDMTSGEQAH